MLFFAEMSFIESHGFLYRFMYIQVSMLLIRYRYVFCLDYGYAFLHIYYVLCNAENYLVKSSKLLKSSIFINYILICLKSNLNSWLFNLFSGEAIQNAAGLGLHFVNGNPQWDLTANVDIWKMEVRFQILREQYIYPKDKIVERIKL